MKTQSFRIPKDEGVIPTLILGVSLFVGLSYIVVYGFRIPKDEGVIPTFRRLVQVARQAEKIVSESRRMRV